MHLAATLFIGFIAGWIVGVLTRGHGFGLLGNTLVGVVGSLIGSFVFGFTGLAAVTWVGSVVRSVVGALALFFVINVLGLAKPHGARE